MKDTLVILFLVGMVVIVVSLMSGDNLISEILVGEASDETSLIREIVRVEDLKEGVNNLKDSLGITEFFDLNLDSLISDASMTSEK